MRDSCHIAGLAHRALASAALWAVLATVAPAAEVVLKDGRILRGKVGQASSLTLPNSKPNPDGPPEPRLVVIIDDDLRRMLLPKQRIAEVRPGDAGEVLERFQIKQAVRRNGMRVQSVASIERIEPFDEYGRRTFSMITDRGPLAVFQGITEITPHWTKVEGLNYVWDQRIATSSIPQATLDAILARKINPKNVEQRLQLARLYLQAQRFEEAGRVLDAIVAEFPEVGPQVAPQREALAQLATRRMLSEIRLRATAGQHQLVTALLTQFPGEQAAGDTLQAVRTMLDEQQSTLQNAERLKRALAEKLAALDNAELRKRAQPLADEIAAELSVHSLPRLAAFERLLDDPSMGPASHVALATSGWLGGATGATEDLSVALSLFELRELVVAYLRETNANERRRLLDEIGVRYGATPELLSRLIAQLKPPLPLPEPRPEAPGFYELTVRTVDPEPDTTYLVQLPPEYDPRRRYPTIVTLHAAFTTPSQQIDWWAGAVNSRQQRLGQATRQGYIVIAPAWTKEQQKDYDYSAHAHAAVLNSLRDATRRLSIDTDRVFITGHSIGGNAAWDLALAHPDLWAGAIPIAAVSDRFTNFYWENARHLPFYLVQGELDGDKPVRNARDLDRMFTRGYDVQVAEYRGRGHEHFSDEVLALFEWMAPRRRDFFPRDFEVDTMRAYDNYFWWVEVEGHPERTLVDPRDWPPPRGTRPMRIDARVTPTNHVQLRTGSDRALVWLSPELVDFQRKLAVTINGRRTNGPTPSIEVLLEDVRTRGDRLHPFWAKVEWP